ncbi:MAG TPA: hypothetical protein VLT36_24130 [Candidatus Dormibacteraeota bacterium]|nr:hypothetical protein [Candidatus Dormibacteraeota bacterium]
MKEDVQIETTTYGPTNRLRRASWGAIFAGVFVTVVLQLMLTLLGAAIGFATFQSQDSTQGTTTASGIWMLVSGLVSVWVGACIAGRLAGGPRRADGMLHGIITWSVATVAALLLLATAFGAVLGGVGSFLGTALNSAAGQNGLAALETQGRNLAGDMQQALPPTGRDNSAVDQNSQQGQDNAAAQTTQNVKELGHKAAPGAAQGSLWGFIALLLGLLVSAWGGWAGTASLPKPIITSATAAAA